MERQGANRQRVLELLEEYGGATPGNARRIHQETGVPEADVYGVASFYSLLRTPGRRTRVCQGLSCQLQGADTLAKDLRAAGQVVERVSCLGQCDHAPAAIDSEHELLSPPPAAAVSPANERLPINLGGADAPTYRALARARQLGAEAVLQQLEAAGLQGRGGAGFPAHLKWRAVRSQPDPVRFVVVNADEGEPGTFKDREVMLRRPHLLIEGMAIAAFVSRADTAYLYVRGEFQGARRALENALQVATPHLRDLKVHIVLGHGAYICGEETALLEAIEGRRGMPRLKPPYPTERGLWGHPTLMNNVETLACVPAILFNGGQWFRNLGRTEPGTKLYCLSGHVKRPGVYELPLGSTLDELVAAAGGYIGQPRAFSPGGASAGFLPMSHRDTPLDFKHLAAAGSMLGSAGVVVLNDTVNMAEAALTQQAFFQDESCGQCAPCRIGCRMQHQAIEAFLRDRAPEALDHVQEVAWEMDEGSICGLGMVASQPLITARQHFPEDFS